jgi:hypothetical protein
MGVHVLRAEILAAGAHKAGAPVAVAHEALSACEFMGARSVEMGLCILRA